VEPYQGGQRRETPRANQAEEVESYPF